MIKKPPTNAGPPDRAEREKIVTRLDANLIVEAGAGTGKTESMVNRMAALLAARKYAADELAAVTFTHKAAAELRDRFRRGVEKAAAEATDAATKAALDAALRRSDATFIGTVHAFCARLLRERPVEAGVPLEFAEMEEVENAALMLRAWRETTRELHARGEPALRTLREYGIRLRDLEPGFKVFAAYPDVDDWGDDYARTPDVATFRDACLAFIEREDLAALVASLAGGDHGELLRELEKFHDLVRNIKWDDIAEVNAFLDLKRDRKKAVRKWPGSRKEQSAAAERHARAWERFYDDALEPYRRSVSQAAYPHVIALYRAAAAAFERLRRDRAALNFQDLLLRAAALLRSGPGVREYFAGRYKCVLVDEFQDTDPVQAEVLLLLTAENAGENDWRKCRPRPGSLFVVGDPKQSIYRFRRADIVTYDEVKRVIIENGGELVRLTANFRTTPTLLAWLNAFFENAFAASGGAPYQASYDALVAGRTDAGEGELAGRARVLIPVDEAKNQDRAAASDAGTIASFVRDALASGKTVPVPPRTPEDARRRAARGGDFLILTRQKKRLGVYARALEIAGVPHAVTGGDALNRAEELAVLQRVLAAVADPDNAVALVAALRSTAFGVSDAMLYDVKAAAGPALQPFSFHAAVPRGLPDETADAIKNAYGRFRKYAGWLDRLPPLAAIEKVASDLALGPWAAAAEGGNERAGAFYKALEVLRAGQTERWSPSQVADALTEIIKAEETALWQDALPVRPGAEEASARVMNLHKAKGLEAPVVFLADPSGGGEHEPDIHIDRTGRRTAGRLAVLRRYGSSGIPLAAPPDWDAAGEESRKFGAAEELRLRYVAATRAGALLVVSEKEGGAKAANDPWNDFHAALADAPALPPASESGEAAAAPLEVTAADVAKARKEIDSNRKLAAEKSYEKAGEKELALKEIPVGTGSGDVTWGRVIHRLLEAAARGPEVVTRVFTAHILNEEGADGALADEAMATVAGVMESGLWRRAQAAGRRAAELPYWRKDIGADGFPRVVGGVIDLAFEEPDGWVIVDYKTAADASEPPEARPADEAQLRAYARAWREMTAATVKEGGVLYIGAAGRAPVYIPVAI